MVGVLIAQTLYLLLAFKHERSFVKGKIVGDVNFAQ